MGVDDIYENFYASLAVGFAIIKKTNKASYRLFKMLDEAVGHLYYS